MKRVFRTYNDFCLAKRRTFLKFWIKNLPQTPQTYGLVHADLVTHNLLVQPGDNTIGIIDFDDSCYHFFAFDLAIVIYAMANRFEHSLYNALEQEWTKHHIEGYQQIRSITHQEIIQIARFIEFACLRLFFWIEYHQNLNTFDDNAVGRVHKLKEWALGRIVHT